MQAGLTPRRLTVREIFSSRMAPLFGLAPSVSLAARGMRLAAFHHLMMEAPRARTGPNSSHLSAAGSGQSSVRKGEAGKPDRLYKLHSGFMPHA